ncbi:Polyisoprenoid-binding protein YceI [Flavobacterium omnivorum]|uniref:Polyisoprenoid-binding protein YceI n=1 Tax=Flavobacterium omnivorum TaxID=178355 RepID=A0A1G8AIA7_9FLAO|nr:YceI family protein [Flavobacterium omnivorum]SDH20661.1 Polyisoprenoid-binding protein YceI [Flavobacterium omnivorum]
MKNLKSIALALVVVLSTLSVTAQTKKVNTSASTINWVGKKVTGAHEGTINLKDGTLVFKGKKLVGGTFVVDMTSMIVTDLKAGQGKEKLEGHLKADDFFGSDKFATATLVFKKLVTKAPNVYTVTGDLTIKGITKPVTFDLATTTNTATANVKIDRTKYDIKYGSGSFFDSLGDKAINDDFDLAIALKF